MVLIYFGISVIAEEEEVINAVEMDGYALRTVDEDVGAVDEPLL